MKVKIQHWAFLLLLTAGLAACKPEDLVLDPPPSKLDGIHGTFTLAEAIQVDPFVIGSGNSLDVTSAFSGSSAPTISFDATAFTFTYTAGGGPNYLGASGTWAFDSNEYPTLIAMNDGTAQYDLKLLHTIRPQDEYLQVQYERSCSGTVSVIYQFKFARN